MERKTVLFVEPLFYGVYLVKAAKMMNHKVVAIVSDKANPVSFGYEQYYDDYIIADTKDGESIVKAIEHSNYNRCYDALIPGTDYVTGSTAKAAELLDMKGTPYFAAQCARNKDMAKEVFAKRNIPCAKYSKVSSLELAIASAKKIGYPVVLKPSNACGSQNVFYINNEKDLIDSFKIINKFDSSYLDYKINDNYLIEEFLEGQEFSVELFILNKKIEFAEVTEKIISNPPYFVELVHVFPTSILQEKKDEIIKVCHDAVIAVGFLDGPTHVEVKYTKDGPKLIEINGRPGGDNITSDLIYNAYGINIFEQMVRLYLNEEIKIHKQRDRASAVGYIVANKKGILNKIKGLNEITSDKNLVRFEIESKPLSNIDIPKESDDRLGYIIIEESNPLKAKQAIYSILDKLEICYE